MLWLVRLSLVFIGVVFEYRVAMCNPQASGFRACRYQDDSPLIIAASSKDSWVRECRCAFTVYEKAY